MLTNQYRQTLQTGQNSREINYMEQPWFVLSAANDFRILLSRNPAISYFYSFEVKRNNRTDFAVPDGCIDIVFDCDEVKPTVKVCGSTLEARSADFIPGHRYFGVRFVLCALPEFLNVRANELVDHELGVLELVPDFERVFNSIVMELSFTSQAHIFDNFFADQALRRSSRLTLNVAQVIIQSRGSVRSGALEKLTGYSIRTIQRKFQTDIGMSPKMFGRIVRCQSAISVLNKDENVNCTELAFELGFCDQPHFLREFKRQVSVTPLEYQHSIREKNYSKQDSIQSLANITLVV